MFFNLLAAGSFYYEENAQGVSFSETPTPLFALERAINGQRDFFYQTSEAIARKEKKKIIFYDVWRSSENIPRNQNPTDEINHFLNYDFEVYQVVGERLQKITNAKQLSSTPPRINRRQLSELLSKHKIENDKTFIIV